MCLTHVNEPSHFLYPLSTHFFYPVFTLIAKRKEQRDLFLVSTYAMWQNKGFPKRHAQNHEQTLIEITSRFTSSRHLNEHEILYSRTIEIL